MYNKERKNSSNTNIPNNHKTQTTQNYINFIHGYSHILVHIHTFLYDKNMTYINNN